MAAERESVGDLECAGICIRILLDGLDNVSDKGKARARSVLAKLRLLPALYPHYRQLMNARGAILPEIDVLSLGIKCLRNSACTLPDPTTRFTGSLLKCG